MAKVAKGKTTKVCVSQPVAEPYPLGTLNEHTADYVGSRSTNHFHK